MAPAPLNAPLWQVSQVIAVTALCCIFAGINVVVVWQDEHSKPFVGICAFEGKDEALPPATWQALQLEGVPLNTPPL